MSLVFSANCSIVLQACNAERDIQSTVQSVELYHFIASAKST